MAQQNIYDDEIFFEGYKRLGTNKINANNLFEIPLQSKEEAQNAPTPITTYALFLDGNYITNEQMNDKRFLKILEK